LIDGYDRRARGLVSALPDVDGAGLETGIVCHRLSLSVSPPIKASVRAAF
jgi:hypothetical protein